ncbi:phage exclusion protein Lit family protein [Amphritea sp. 2_MG-2023]|uniref:phage exclusion protein Lit family protein n=1 Tax=Amphritea TaxID=515417 RepID=UPI001C06B264|nr:MULTISPECIES: phage exclusion protein Lit family protein [Amphritea]MBU2966923.1 hypothetical protein [Amphritea atlantica]MDO6420737.1 phage exclusion protein Lit family protein [Amphritea sp. 2_MG-2023]
MNLNDITESDAIKSLIIASAPEKKSELLSLWDKYEPTFSLKGDSLGFSMSVIFDSVVFDHKTMCQMWLLGFAAQKSLHALGELSSNSSAPNSLYLKYSQDFNVLVDSVLKLKSVERVEDFLWPDNTPKPYDGKPTDVDGSMVFDLICMSGAYCFLHEIKHIMFGKSNTQISIHDEEMECDRFAREFLLSGTAEYSMSEGYNSELVSSKRAMSIALSSFFLFVITPREKWGATDTHPPIKERILALSEYTSFDENDYFWQYFSGLSLALVMRNQIPLEQQVVVSHKVFCLSMIELLDNAI